MGRLSAEINKALPLSRLEKRECNRRALFCLAPVGQHRCPTRAMPGKFNLDVPLTGYTRLIRSPITEKIEWHFVKRTTMALFAAIPLDL